MKTPTGFRPSARHSILECSGCGCAVVQPHAKASLSRAPCGVARDRRSEPALRAAKQAREAKRLTVPNSGDYGLAAFGCQSSSVVEQRTHKPLVGGSNPSSGTIQNPNETRINKGVSPLHFHFRQSEAIPGNGCETGHFGQPRATAPVGIHPTSALQSPSIGGSLPSSRALG